MSTGTKRKNNEIYHTNDERRSVVAKNDIKGTFFLHCRLIIAAAAGNIKECKTIYAEVADLDTWNNLLLIKGGPFYRSPRDYAWNKGRSKAVIDFLTHHVSENSAVTAMRLKNEENIDYRRGEIKQFNASMNSKRNF